jgi:hypothetical protein
MVSGAEFYSELRTSGCLTRFRQPGPTQALIGVWHLSKISVLKWIDSELPAALLISEVRAFLAD